MTNFRTNWYDPIMEKSSSFNSIIQNCSTFFKNGRSPFADENKAQLNLTGLDNGTDIFVIPFSDPVVVMKTVGLGLMILLTILGNMLVIASVLPSPTLRTPTHSLIVNLAVADLLLGKR